MMEQLLYRTALFDLYGELLTEHQQKCMELYLFENFSLAEIGEEMGISRQAVHDNIHRSQKTLEKYEEKLKLVERYRRERAELAEISGLVRNLRRPDNEKAVDEVLKRLSSFLERGRGGLN